jgi:carbon storage regulator
MLVLSRKEGESLVFPALEIEITVVEIRGDKVRIGITADREKQVYRNELLERLDFNGGKDARVDE